MKLSGMGLLAKLLISFFFFSQPLAKDTLETVHPLQSNAFKGIHNEKQLRMQQLRRLYGVHIPISMMNEERATRNVGHLPILPRHNAMLDSLTGRDNGLCFTNVLSTDAFKMKSVQPVCIYSKSSGIPSFFMASHVAFHVSQAKAEAKPG
nr:EOG090X0J8E [Artemia franciscana]